MGFLRKALSAVADFTSTQRSYLVVLDKDGTQRRIPLEKNYTRDNPPPQNVLEMTSTEYAARLTP
ncbi:MAG TPA: hypothetical protein VFS88_06635 [Micavibrio sp.]|nr:hypothetical protein [Micavibrio sp.]